MTDDSLQFDRAETGGSAESGVRCVACKGAIPDEYFAVRGQTVCRSCRDRIAGQLATTPLNLPKSTLFGLGGAIAGAVIYYAVAAIANVEIGLVAIAAGWLVGRAMQIGGGGGGGTAFQIMAASLTYLSVAVAYLAVRVHAVVEGTGMSVVEAVAAISRRSPLSVIGLPLTENLADLPMGALGLLIVGVGVYQAWRMTAKVVLTFEGPFRVGQSTTAGSRG